MAAQLLTVDPVQDLQVGKTVHTGVAPELRTELWMSVLLRKGIGSEAAKNYRKMLAKVYICLLAVAWLYQQSARR